MLRTRQELIDQACPPQETLLAKHALAPGISPRSAPGSRPGIIPRRVEKASSLLDARDPADEVEVDAAQEARVVRGRRNSPRVRRVDEAVDALVKRRLRALRDARRADGQTHTREKYGRSSRHRPGSGPSGAGEILRHPVLRGYRSLSTSAPEGRSRDRRDARVRAALRGGPRESPEHGASRCLPLSAADGRSSRPRRRRGARGRRRGRGR